MLQETLVRTPESLEVQPGLERSIRNKRLSRYGLAVVVLGLSAAAFLRPHQRELDFSLILKGFSETLEELPEKPADEFVESLEIPASTPCFANVRDCFNRLDSMEETPEFRETLDECLYAAFECVTSVEEQDEQHATEEARKELEGAIVLLRKRDIEPGMEMIVNSLKNAADAIGKQFPEVARFVKAVITHIMKLLQKFTPVVVEHAKKLGEFASQEIEHGLKILKDNLPTVIRKCKCGASYAGREVNAAASMIRQELPRLQKMAEDTEKNAMVIFDALLSKVPKLVETCKTEIAKAQEDAENLQKIQGALLVAAALGGGLLLLHHHANQIDDLDVTKMDEEEEQPTFLSLVATDYAAVVAAYDSGRWEDLGRLVGRLVVQ